MAEVFCELSGNCESRISLWIFSTRLRLARCSAEFRSGIGVDAHHVDVAAQLLGLCAGDVACFVHVLNHTELDAVALAFDLFGLRLCFGAVATFGRARSAASPRR